MIQDDPALHPEVIVYGGAFDPPHQGHIDCVEEALANFPGSRVMIIPGFKPAGAKGLHKEPDADFDDRMTMAKKAFVTKETQGRVEISPLESELACPNYTYLTLAALTEKLGRVHIGLMIGLDQFKVFHGWQNPEAILSQNDLVVVRRDTQESIVKVAEELAASQHLGLLWSHDFKVAELQNAAKTRIYILDTDTAKAASSDIKFRLQKGKAIPKGWLPKPILAFIAAKRLYREDTP